MNIMELGWNSFFEQHFGQFKRQGLKPGRVAREHKQRYAVYSQHGELIAEVSGKIRHAARSRSDFPAVGDWVAVAARLHERRATIQALLPRTSSFSRKAVLSGGMPDTGGKIEEQVLATNVDTVFLVCGLDGDFNLRRIERYLTVAWDSGANPVVVLNKSDLCSDVEAYIKEAESCAFGVPIRPMSAVENEGVNALREYLDVGKTAVFLGSSGVGKSALINSLLGIEHLKVAAVRESDGRGRHTTAVREMILVPTGGVVIDTPGMRELAAWGDDEGLKKTFDDIEQLAAQCRFRDCSHQHEPGCAVQEALEQGTLDAGRMRSYSKLSKELKYLAIRKDQRARLDNERIWKKISQWSKSRRKLE
ncbi:MAG: ribosome small subunit-dependent GTPase A [Candidatus Zixiibacteriota bacterium]